MKTGAPILLLLLACGPASAAMYSCADEYGAKVLRNYPCNENEKQREIPTAQTGPSYSVIHGTGERQYYRGRTPEEMAALAALPLTKTGDGISAKDANLHPINQAALHWLNKTDWGASEDSLHAITLMRWGIEELGTTADIWETPEDAFHSTEILARLNPHLAIKVLEMPQNPELADEEATLTGEALMEAEDQEVAALMLLENLAEAARPQAYSWSTLTDLSNQA